MRTIELPWETWRAVIAALREKGLPYMLEHVDYPEESCSSGMAWMSRRWG
jgi:hypothetical protein